MRISFLTCCIVLICITFSSANQTPRPFDVYSHINCKEEVARIDNYVEQLKKEPSTFAFIAVYGGRNDTKRGEVIARLNGIREYLVNRHGINPERIILLNGGFRERLTVELWVTPFQVRKEDMASPTLKPEDVSFKKGRTIKWAYECVK